MVGMPLIISYILLLLLLTFLFFLYLLHYPAMSDGL